MPRLTPAFTTMRIPRWTVLLACLLGSPGLGAVVKTCEDLVVEIAAKIDATGIKGYTLEIVPAELVSGDKVVGTCDRGTKKITYMRSPAPERPPRKP